MVEAYRAIHRAIDELVDEVLAGDLGTFWSEDDLAARHWARLRELLAPRIFEVHLELGTVGLKGRKRPDLTLIPRANGPWADRRQVRAIYAAEFKSFAARGGRSYQIGQPGFDELLGAQDTRDGSSILAEFNRLADRTQSSRSELDCGLLLWRDCFDWQNICAKRTLKRDIIAARAGWVRTNLSRPGSRIRVAYLPVMEPDLAILVDNGFSDLISLPRRWSKWELDS